MDQDVDGVGDNADAFPLSAFEWLDSDGDGLGDNADQFPFDSQGKYDTDGDGIANSMDPFPNSPSLDSWFDIIVRIMLLAGGLAFAGFYFKRKQSEGQVDELEHFNRLQQDALLSESSKPTVAPPMESFSNLEPVELQAEMTDEPAYPYLPPPQM